MTDVSYLDIGNSKSEIPIFPNALHVLNHNFGFRISLAAPFFEDINPLAHYLATGHALGLAARPPESVAQRADTGARFPAGKRVRRICLFAGYDADGLVDPYVVDYLRELSRYADVYYLADCTMRPGELDKLRPYTRAATAVRHGEYDFGSYSRLVRELGWDVLAEYDELVLANDSCSPDS